MSTPQPAPDQKPQQDQQLSAELVLAAVGLLRLALETVSSGRDEEEAP
jgi:hypothetical protein